MSTRPLACHIVDCDVCPDSLENGDTVWHFKTEAEALKWAEEEGWTDLGDGRHACTRSNPAHDDARDAARVPAA